MVISCLPASCWWKSFYLPVLLVPHNPPAHPSIVSFPLALISLSCELFWAPATAQPRPHWIFSLGWCWRTKGCRVWKHLFARDDEVSVWQGEVETGWRCLCLRAQRTDCRLSWRRSGQQESWFLCPSCKIVFALRSKAGPRVGMTQLPSQVMLCVRQQCRQHLTP